MNLSEAEIAARVAAFAQLLDVKPSAEAGHFVGMRNPGGIGRVFGGQVIAQAMMAATRTAPDNRPIHSLHCYFMRPASEDFDLDYTVEADLDGKAFSNRRVVARQQGKPVFNMSASFHVPEEGLVHQSTMPNLPPPETLVSLADYVKTHPDKVSPLLKRLHERPGLFDYRPVADLTPEALGRPNPGMSFCWIRIGAGPLGLPQTVQRALLAWLSDTMLLATAYRAHGIQIGMGGFQSASLDHNMWFHDDIECGEWMLFTVFSPWTGGARGLAVGHCSTRDGRLVATVCQEGLMRPIRA